MSLMGAFATDVAMMFREIGRDMASAGRDLARDFAAPFKDAAWLRREGRRLERGGD